MVKRKTLSTIVAEDLSEKIRSGLLQPGVQLATEAELCAEYNVSRTVVREAVARLRSEGMVIPQQGRGMFVSEAPTPRNFSIPDEALKTLPETIALLELRLSVEAEAAGLCAERRTDAEATAIRDLMEQVDARHENPASVQIHYDYDFHLAIARASQNRFFVTTLEALRSQVEFGIKLSRSFATTPLNERLDSVLAEHREIHEAIRAGDPDRAKRAVALHLEAGIARLFA